MMLKFHWYPTRSKTWSTLVSEVKTLIDVIKCYTGISDLCVYIQNRVAILDVFVSILCCWKGVLYIRIQMSLVCTQLRNSAVLITKSMRLKVMLHHIQGESPPESATILAISPFLSSFFSFWHFPSPSVSLMFLSQGCMACLPLSPSSLQLYSPLYISHNCASLIMHTLAETHLGQ